MKPFIALLPWFLCCIIYCFGLFAVSDQPLDTKWDFIACSSVTAWVMAFSALCLSVHNYHKHERKKLHENVTMARHSRPRLINPSDLV